MMQVLDGIQTLDWIKVLIPLINTLKRRLAIFSSFQFKHNSNVLSTYIQNKYNMHYDYKIVKAIYFYFLMKANLIQLKQISLQFFFYMFLGGGITHSLSWHRKGERIAGCKLFARVWTPEDPRLNQKGHTTKYSHATEQTRI